jgi:uncharacterized protein
VSSDVEVLKEPARFTLDDLARIARPILRRLGAERAIIFGSWARGTADGFSDLDLVVVRKTDRPFVDRGLDLAPLLDALPVAVDVLVYTPEEFAAAMKRGVGIFDALRREGVDLL